MSEDAIRAAAIKALRFVNAKRNRKPVVPTPLRREIIACIDDLLGAALDVLERFAAAAAQRESTVEDSLRRLELFLGGEWSANPREGFRLVEEVRRAVNARSTTSDRASDV